MYVLGIDLGTTYFKVGLFDHKGKMCGLGRIKIENQSTSKLHFEISKDLFWKYIKKGIAKACNNANARRKDIVSVAYSSQANSFTLLDKDNKPLIPFILWPDKRVKQVHSNINTLQSVDDFHEYTGLGMPISEQFCISKLLWIRDNHHRLWQKVNQVMSLSDYFTYSLTNKKIGDGGTAALLGILKIKSLNWWDKALKILELDPEKLVLPLRPGTKIGKISKSGASRIGIPEGIPFAIGGLDHQLAAIGSGIGTHAKFVESTGTVLSLISKNNEYKPKKNICKLPGFSDSSYFDLTFSNNGTGMLDWYFDEFIEKQSLQQGILETSKVPIGSAGIKAKPMAHTYDDLFGFEGTQPEHNHAHYVKSILECISFSLNELIENLNNKKKPKLILSTGGGAKSDIWLQMKANVCGIPFATTNSDEPACKGAGIIAALASGWFNSIEDIAKQWIEINKVFYPDHSKHELYRRLLKKTH